MHDTERSWIIILLVYGTYGKYLLRNVDRHILYFIVYNIWSFISEFDNKFYISELIAYPEIC